MWYMCTWYRHQFNTRGIRLLLVLLLWWCEYVAGRVAALVSLVPPRPSSAQTLPRWPRLGGGALPLTKTTLPQWHSGGRWVRGARCKNSLISLQVSSFQIHWQLQEYDFLNTISRHKLSRRLTSITKCNSFLVLSSVWESVLWMFIFFRSGTGRRTWRWFWLVPEFWWEGWCGANVAQTSFLHTDSQHCLL